MNQIEKPTTLIIDNAPTHTSNEFNDCLAAKSYFLRPSLGRKKNHVLRA
ncbi:MAG: hypothetical protein L3J01_02605 [Thiomicrorhabdus sp.]|nr:hypothetical protein [Thiomicrorhabdus sp.]